MVEQDQDSELVVTAGEGPKRLDLFLVHREPSLSRAAVQRLIEDGSIRVNGRATRPSYKIRPGDRIALRIPRPQPIEIQPEPIPLSVLHEDDALLVLDKPPGLVVHPAPGHWSGTLVNALLYHFGPTGAGLSSVGGRERPGLVHRLDKETSGVMVVAKTDEAHRVLAAQFTRHTITRVYEALVWGLVKKPAGLIELAIGRDIKERKKFSARTTRARASATQFRVLERYPVGATRIELTPRTGRTHQIRVHLAAVHHPLLGDPTYGGKRVKEVGGVAVPRVMLHARTLGFRHPLTQRDVEYTAPLPDDMAEVCEALRFAPAERGSRAGGRSPIDGLHRRRGGAR